MVGYLLWAVFLQATARTIIGVMNAGWTHSKLAGREREDVEAIMPLRAVIARRASCLLHIGKSYTLRYAARAC